MKRFLIACLLTLVTAPAFAQGTVMPIPLAQWFDNDGAPLVGGGICVYLAGTSTEATTYTTAALSVANANPIPLNSAGRPTSGGVFLTPGTSYKFVLKSATVTTCTPDTGVTIWSVDNVEAVPSSASSVDLTAIAGEAIAAGEVVYLSDGSASKNAGQLYRADADLFYSVVTPMVGIAPNAIASGASGAARLQGEVSGMSGLTPGSAYYVSGTVGGVTVTAPTNVRYVGQSLSATSMVVGANPPPAVTWNAAKSVNNFRLTLTTATPVTTADVTAATTVYWTPYTGNVVGLYTGTTWVSVTSAQLSIAVPNAANQLYDVFVDYNDGTPALSLTAWTNDTTRATALVTQDGVYVKTGDTQQRYVGSFRTTAVAGQTEDSLTKRLVWNYYNRVERSLQRLETTASWTYSANAWQQANASATNQVAVVVGVNEVRVTLTLKVAAGNAASSSTAVGIGLDSVAALASNQSGMYFQVWAGQIASGLAFYSGYVGVGYHYLSWLERTDAVGATTWYGNGLPFGVGEQSGLLGVIWG